jgi:hypothetical protein
VENFRSGPRIWTTLDPRRAWGRRKTKIAPACISDLPLTAAGEQEKQITYLFLPAASCEELLELVLCVAVWRRVDIIWNVTAFFMRGKCEGELDANVLQKRDWRKKMKIYWERVL